MSILIHKEDPQIVQKEKENHDYITEHITNINKAYVMYFLPILEYDNFTDNIILSQLQSAIKQAAPLIHQHDLSKYSDEEFDGYRYRFYPTDVERNSPDYESNVKELFEDRAWKHHYQNNAHHPQFWKDDNGNIQDMEIVYIVEMICDWISMSIKFGTSTMDWWNNKASEEKSYMTDNTKDMVESIFKIIF